MTRMDLMQGTLDLLVLRTLSGSSKHGYQIARTIKNSSSEVLQVEEGALYPALHRLKGKGWIEGKWGVSENNRRAKFYELTDSGREALRVEADRWDRYVSAVGQIMAKS